MKKLYIIFILASATNTANGQMAINKTGNPSNAASILDLSDASNNTVGLLMTNVSIGNVNSASPVTSPPDGLIVYNTNASTTGGSGKGFYYWSTTGSKWYYLSNNGTTAAAYTILGNNTGSTSAPTYFTPTLASALFQNQGSTATVLHGNASGNPSWGAINLATDITGNLPMANIPSGGNSTTYLRGDGNWATVSGGSGTVTSVSASNLSPLFTTSVSNATTTPAISYSISNAGANTILGNNTGSSAAPSYFTPSLTSTLFANQGTTTTVLHGNASGDETFSAVNLATDVTGNLPVTNLNNVSSMKLSRCYSH